jgi:biotin carboxyl carrier protein
MDYKEEDNMGEYSELLISSGKFTTEITKKFEKRKVWKGLDPKKIYTVIPGTIIDVLVKKGQNVKKGETLLILEAMKMQNLITTPVDGKIKSIHVKPDDKLPRSFLMIELA